MFIEHKRLYDAFIFQKDAHLAQPGTLMLMFMLSSDLVSPRTLERLKQKPQTQQVIHFFQEAGYGLRLGNESVECFERTSCRPFITRQKCDGNIRLTSPHVDRGRITIIHLGHVLVEKHQVNWIHCENLNSIFPACGGQNLIPVFFK